MGDGARPRETGATTASESTATTAPGKESPGARIQKLLASGETALETVARAFLAMPPADQPEAIATLHRTLGNGYVRSLLEIVKEPPSEEDAEAHDLFESPVMLADSTTGTPPKPPKKERPKPAPAEKYSDYVVKPAGAPTGPAVDPLAGAKALDGSAVGAIKTVDAEGRFLNEVRKSNKRFNATALQAAQLALGVSNASGAFNTDTLRQLQIKTKTTIDPKSKELKGDPPAKTLLVAASLFDDAFWKPFYSPPTTPAAPPEPMFLTEGSDVLPTDPADETQMTTADRVAQGVGAKDYASWRAAFVAVPTFLGIGASNDGNHEAVAHPALVQRLAAAERFIRNHFKDQKVDGKPLTDKQMRQKIGWGDVFVTVYHKDPHLNAKNKTNWQMHPHNMGIAVDFDPDRNPWVFNESVTFGDGYGGQDKKNKDEIKANKAARTVDPSVAEVTDQDQIAPGAAGAEARDWYTNMFHAAYKVAADLYHGVVLTKEKLKEWSETLSTEELHARVTSASDALEHYLTDGEAVVKEGSGGGPVTTKVLGLFAAAGYSADQAKQGIVEMGKFPPQWKKYGRDGTQTHTGKNKKTNTQSLELTVALRDAGGLAWGGTELSGHSDNGDFMHFDLRNNGVGDAVLRALQHPHVPPKQPK